MENTTFEFRDNSNNSEYIGTQSTFVFFYISTDIIVSFFAFVLNSLVIFTFIRDKNLRNRLSYFILSLALSDFMAGVLAIPLGISIESQLIFGHFPCLFAVTTVLSFFSVSKLSILAISYDRYCAVVNPLAYHRKKKHSSPKITILMCWMTGLFVGYLPALGWNDGTRREGICTFKNMKTTEYYHFRNTLVTVIPFISLVFIYGLIYREIRNMYSSNDDTIPSTSSIDDKDSSSTSNIRRIKRREIKLTINISIIVLFFLLCWAPLNILNVVEIHTGKFDAYTYLLKSFIVLSHLNSVINPLLYSFQLETFRNAVKRELSAVLRMISN